jgi:hypothetical protein
MYFVTAVIKTLKIVKNIDILAWGNLITHISVAVLVGYREEHGALYLYTTA